MIAASVCSMFCSRRRRRTAGQPVITPTLTLVTEPERVADRHDPVARLPLVGSPNFISVSGAPGISVSCNARYRSGRRAR